MSKICTSQEQSKKLVELGIDVNTADMYYDCNSYGIQGKPEVAVGKVWSKDIPTWSLTALLKLIPKFSLERIYLIMQDINYVTTIIQHILMNPLMRQLK